jgi:hypothetical protein
LLRLEEAIKAAAGDGAPAERTISAHRAVRARYLGLNRDSLAAAFAGEFAIRKLDNGSLVAHLGARRVRTR